MFKLVLLLTSFFAAPGSASAATPLDEAYSGQEQILIAPVEYQGFPVTAMGGFDSAALICNSLNYSRVVDFKSTKVKGKQLRAAVPQGTNSIYYQIKTWSGVVIFDEIRCAR